MDRVLVIGTSGSGKTTFARQISAVLAIPHVELDAMFHQPGWTELPRDEFRRRIADVAATQRWVVDGNYRKWVGDLLWNRADTVVWIDLPRATVMRQIVPRTLRRLITREELWNGNREPLGNLWRWDPQRSIIRWAWTQHAVYRKTYSDITVLPEHTHLDIVRLTSRREVRNWLNGLAATMDRCR